MSYGAFVSQSARHVNGFSFELPKGILAMDIYILVMSLLMVVLIGLNIYQYLVMRAALRIAEILYVMSRHVREKASEVRRSQKDVEIIEAHLFDMATSARSLLRALGRGERSIDPDPALSISTNGHPMNSDSMVRLADNILYAIREEHPDFGWEETIEAAMDLFLKKLPGLEREPARKIIMVVAHEHRARALQQRLQKDNFEQQLLDDPKEA